MPVRHLHKGKSREFYFYENHEEIEVGDFGFKCIQSKEDLNDKQGWIDVAYQIQVGDKSHESYISEWSNDWDEIRHDLEHLLFHDRTEIQLLNEDSPTTIVLERRIVDCKRFENNILKEKGLIALLKVEVFPSEFEEREGVEPFSGYGEYIMVLKGIYQGLLSLANAYPDTNEENEKMTKSNVRSKLTSQLLENHISKYEKTPLTRLHYR